MKPMRTLLTILFLAVGLCACGGNESNPGPAEQGTVTPESPFLGYTDLNDATVTSLHLTTSSEYDPDANQVRIFALLKDQDGASLFPPDHDFNTHNFYVTLNTSMSPVNVPSDVVGLSIEASNDQVVALVLDSSGSMSGRANPQDPTDATTRLGAGQGAARLFLSKMGATDRAAVVTFSDSARTVQPLTGDAELLGQAINSLTATGATNFGAAIGEAVRAVGTRPGKRAMILLTDGDDTIDTITGGPDAWLNNPTSTRYQGLLLAKQNDFRIYTVGLGADISSVGEADLRTFAAQTGGTYFPAPSTGSLDNVFGSTIPQELSGLAPVETYVLSFQNPVPQRRGKDVAYRVTAFYVNANGNLYDKSPGTYRFP
ncbi:MAG: VWA domain-containing protein [Deltaproteobacteria bacterium]|nr:VWA domain-containing protein [Deltaproteobacteria bacterium]